MKKTKIDQRVITARRVGAACAEEAWHTADPKGYPYSENWEPDLADEARLDVALGGSFTEDDYEKFFAAYHEQLEELRQTNDENEDEEDEEDEDT